MSDKFEVPQIRVSITKEIISSSERCNPAKCMVAQALRLHHRAESVHVTKELARFTRDGRRFMYSLPAKAAALIARFDDAGPASIQPFQFSLYDGAEQVIKVPERRPKSVGVRSYKRRLPQPGEMVAKKCVRRMHGLTVVETYTIPHDLPVVG